MSTIFVSNLSQKATEDKLKLLFGTDGEIKKINLFDDQDGKKCAEITYSTNQQALKAVEDMNGKEVLKNKVNVVLVEEEAVPNESEFVNAEYIGELVFPIALSKYGDYAPKITGMIIEAVLGFENQEKILKLLYSDIQLNEIIDAAYQKLNPA